MTMQNPVSSLEGARAWWQPWGLVWLALGVAGAGVFFADGIGALLQAWQTPEYSHGPLIPVLSALLFLRQLKDYPERPGPKPDRWPGVWVMGVALLVGAIGQLAHISDIVAYALILWVGGIVLVSFGWRTGREFWPPVLHLVYMLPLPGVLYYKISTSLQFISSELGVGMLKLMAVPVFLEGNIIDLGVTKLHVAEACSGLRYLFPILSFSYIFAVLYRGPVWHKAVLLLAAVPITVLMNSVRIAVAGYIVNRWGLAWVDGFSHFFEGWVIFVISVVLLFMIAWLMLRLSGRSQSLSEALDLDMSHLGTQAARLRLVWPSPAMIATAVLTAGAATALMTAPDRVIADVERTSFSAFPVQMGDWRQRGGRQFLDEQVSIVLAADDYHQVTLVRESDGASVGLFSAWYADQSQGGVHSPEVCLPGAGWEIAWLERVDIAERLGSPDSFMINRAIIQKGEVRMMVYYWFQQRERRIAWDFAAKFWLLYDAVTTGRSDGALVRLTTPMGADEAPEVADARLHDALAAILPELPRFVPES